MYNIGDIISISFLGQRYDNCEIIDIDYHGGNKGACIVKVRNTLGRIIPYVGVSKDQEKWAYIINNLENVKNDEQN